MDLDREALIQTFTAESYENLDSLEENLLLLEGDEENAEHLNTIFRIAHSLKGNALCLGFDAIGDYADRLEDYLEHLRDGSAAITPATITHLLRIADAVREWIPQAVNAGGPAPDRCNQLLDDLFRAHAAPAARDGGVVALPAVSERSQQSQTLRLDIAKLDRLLNMTTEMLIACGRTAGVLRSMPEQDDRLTSGLDVLDVMSRDINELVMRARMVPIGPLFRQYTRVVRDVCRELGKSARLVIEGGDVEIDASAFDHLRDPLTHLVRNAVDHGLETGDARLAGGKDATGTITLSARQEGRSIIISVSDDGRGLDEDAIVARARERGLLGGDEQAGAGEIRSLIFEPGFTTAAETTKLSGRGVGMDVVKSSIEQIRGEVRVSSTPGKGMTVTLRLPLTVAVIDGLVVTADGESYVVPLDAVVECTEMPSEGKNGRATGVMTYQGAPIPFGCLRSLIGSDRHRAEHENVIIVQHHELRVGIVVDEILGKQDVVMKPLDDWYMRVPFVSGSTILGDGQIGLILDIRAALRHIETKSRRGVAA